MRSIKRTEVRWIIKDEIHSTSLLIWSDQFIPYQVIIYLKNDEQKLATDLCIYTSVEDIIYEDRYLIKDYRTDYDDEILFHVSLLCKTLIDKYSKNKEKYIENGKDKDSELMDLLRELFMSSYAMELMLRKVPHFGFYSLTPNFAKFEKFARNMEYDLYGDIQKLNKKMKKAIIK